MMQAIVLDGHRLRDHHFDLLSSNHLLVLDDGLQNIFQDSTLPLGSSELIWSFKATEADLNAVGVEEFNKASSVVHATVK